MDIFINGKETSFTLEGEKTVRDIVVGIADWLGSQGFKATEAKVDGEPMDQGTGPVEGVGRIDIEAEPGSALKKDILEEALGFIQSLGESPAGGDGRKEAEEGLRDLLGRFDQAFDGGLKDFMGKALDGAGEGPIDPLRDAATLLKERIEEIAAPLAAIAKLPPLLDAVKAALERVPVLLQTSKDAEAIQSFLFFTEIVDKAVRVIRYVAENDPGLEESRIGDKSLAEFWADLNVQLREFAEAFAAMDTVSVGDICEYEIVPRLVLLRNFAAKLAADAGVRD